MVYFTQIVFLLIVFYKIINLNLFIDNFDPYVQMTKSLYRAGRCDEISDILEKTEKNNLRAYNDAAFNFAKGLLT